MIATTKPEPVPKRRRSTVPAPQTDWTDPHRPAPQPQAETPDKEARPEPAFHSRKPHKADGKEIKGQYMFTLELSFVIALALMIGLLRAPLQFGEEDMQVVLAEQEVVELDEIRQTQQANQPPPPPRPPVPVEVPNNTVLEDEVLDLDASFDLEDPVATTSAPPAPPPEEEGGNAEDENEVFIVVEQMPELIGGVAELQRNVRYPEVARRAGVEGRVFVQFIVGPDGVPTDPTVIRGIGAGCDQEAVRAIMEHARFKPGMQRGRAVNVRMSIPINFQLTKAG